MWEVFKNWIFDVIQFFYNFCGDWGLAIIIVTVIFRIIVSPIMHKQAKSNYQMQKIQPQLKKIQEKYAGDQVRQSEELRKLYAEAKFNPLAGCIPMLLQMPIFIAMFQVLRELGMHGDGNNTYTFYSLVPSLIDTPEQALSQGFVTFLPYLILMLVFALATFTPMLLQQMKNDNKQQKNQMIIMAIVMSVFMLWISWTSPAGVLLFWGASSLIGIAQNQFSTARCRKKDALAEAAEPIETKPIEVNVTRKERKKRPTKKH